MNQNFKNSLRSKPTPKNFSFSPPQIISLGFFTVILLGGLLLTLPISSASGQYTPFIKALFTSTSAVCVTGLIVFDTATHWSTFGQFVIISLIQIGGIGVVTIITTFVTLSGKKIGLMSRNTLQEAISAPNGNGILRRMYFILKCTFAIELCGALLMMPVFCKDFGLAKGIWYSFFHSISAFCNAGFDLMGVRTPFSSLTTYSGNYIINIAIMLLIIIGGIGFLTLEDILTHKWRISKYRMQSKTILLVTSLLILLPTIFFYFNDFTSDNIPTHERLLLSFFQAVTPRTAGFNTADLNLMSGGGLTIIIILMLIGGSPGSTAGGIKTTTLAVLFSTAFSTFKKRNEAHLFGRRLESDSIKSASTIFLLYITLFMLGSIAISCIEDTTMLPCLFEVASAIGTVGLSLGLTPSLSSISQLILISLMFFGRVGGLTLIFATLKSKNQNVSKLPNEKITVG